MRDDDSQERCGGLADERLRALVPGTWSASRQAAVRRALSVPPVGRGRRRGPAGLGLLAGAGGLLATAAVLVAVRPSGPEAPSPPAAAPAFADDGQTVRFADGSRVVRAAEAALRVSAAGPSLARVDLAAGRARFEIARRPGRTFRVDAGAVTVEVLGTAFFVERAADRAQVGVSHGRVMVRWPGGSRTLAAGEAGWFPPATAPATAAAPTAAAPGAAPLEVAPPPRPRPPAAPPGAWRRLARAGQHARAYDALEAAGGAGAVKDEPADLLLAADVARLGGHPARAVAPLRALVARFPRDPLAPVAAFTLGRLLAAEAPAQAARAFEDARRLAPTGGLAEDALARAAEAWARAGDEGRARALARAYLEAYPRGRRATDLAPLAAPPR
jgi:transmembrane sensor